MSRPNRARSTFLTLLAAFAALLLAACGGEDTTSDEPIAEEPSVLASLAPGWNKIEPGGDTVCSDGSPFHFFARSGDPDKLLFYLQGGGGCWTGATCDRDLEPTYSTTAVAELVEAKPNEPRPERAMNGIFDYTRNDNPMKDWSAVFVPYCTGDVHLGNALAAYQAPSTDEHEAHEVTVEHKGAVNVGAALEWTYSAFATPAEVLVTGSSAGSIPSPYYAHRIKDRYPSARVTQLGDGSGGYRRRPGTDLPHEQWGTMEVVSDMSFFEGATADDFNYEKLYIAAGKKHPDVMFSRYDAAEDAVQVRFLTISSGDVSSLQELLDANKADIEAEIPNFRSYTVGGDSHTILGRPQFYTYRVGDVSFRDWFAELVAGETVDNVHCGTNCAEAETLADAISSGGQ